MAHKGKEINCERLRECMDEKGIKDYGLAKELGILDNRKQVGKWKSGKTVPTMETVSKIAKILDVNVRYLYGDTDTKDVYEGYYDALEQYQNDKMYLKTMLKQWESVAEGKDFNISVPFIHELRKLMDFDKLFPMDGEAVLVIDAFEDWHYEKRPFPETMELSDNDRLSVFQITRDSKTRCMSLPDICFLKDLQAYLVECAKAYMKERAVQIEEEKQQLTDEYFRTHRITIDNGFAFKQGKLNAAQINKIVRYPVYVDEKKESE